MAAVRTVKTLAAATALGLIAGCVGANPFAGLSSSASWPATGGTGSGLIGNTGSALIGNTGSALTGDSGTAPAGPGSDLLANTGAAFSGQVSGPSTLIANTGAALIGNTGGALIGNTGAAYRLAALSQGPVANSLVYFTNPDEEFITASGRVVATTTDARGHYAIPAVLPEKQYVVVNAMLPQNRRLVGFTVSRQGQNQVDVDLATTYALEFLRVVARREGKTFADFALDRLPDLAGRTRALIEDGHLGVESDDLRIGSAALLADRYAQAMAKSDPALLQAWAALLGHPIAVLLTHAGTFAYGLNRPDPQEATEAPTFTPDGVAIAGDTTYLALFYLNQISTVDAAGRLAPLTARAEFDPTQSPAPPVPESGALLAGTPVPEPTHVAVDAEGNVYVTLNARPDAPRHLILMICRNSSPKFGLSGLETGKIYRIAGTLAPRADDQGFARPWGLTLDDGGNLFVADQANHRIMRIDRGTGQMIRVAGKLPGQPPQIVVDATSPARESALGLPSAVEWRRVGNDEELFVLDALNQRIRHVVAPSGDWLHATMRTLAGSGNSLLAGTGYGVEGGFSGDGGQAASARFHFGRLETADWIRSDLTSADLALSPDNRRLYATDTVNQRVRAIDLATGIVSTVAGGGANPRDGLALNCALGLPTGIAVAANGDIMFADRTRDAVRRLKIGGGTP